MLKIKKYVLMILAALVLFSQETIEIKLYAAEVKTSEASLVSRVAPGEYLLVSIKLLNFGSGKRVDVVIDYQILDKDNRIMLNEAETVAVETTASFVKNIQIPLDLPEGKYAFSSSISYQGQEVPAISKFQFTIENKIAGIFVSQLILYSGITFFIGIVFAIVGRLMIKQRARRYVVHDYSNVLKTERIYYEIVSDMIMQMRSSIGNRAIEIAENIQGLVVDDNSGRVLEINKDPSEIVALLVLSYEKNSGKQIKLTPRKIDKETKNQLNPIDEHLNIIKKYF